MKILDFLINQVFTQASLFLGLIAMIGLVLQKKEAKDVISGTIKTIVGIEILNAGMGVFLGSMMPLTNLLTSTIGGIGIMPDNFGPFGIAIKTFATEISLTFIAGFLIHIFLVRITPIKRMKNVFLTGHAMLFMSTWFIVIFSTITSLTGNGLVIVSSICVGLLWTLLPAWARSYTDEISDGEFTLGHMQTFNIVGGSWIGKLTPKSKKCEDINLPGFLAVFSDYTVLLAVIMPITYVIIGLMAGMEATTKLAGSTYWIIWLILQGIIFTGGVMIVLYGVRIFLSALIPAFQGIAEKVIPGAVPALDSPVFYPFSPVATIIGFLADLVVAVLVTVVLIAIKSPVVVIPGPIFVFFEGALAGVFGNRAGGWKGAILAGSLMGLITHLGAIPLYYLQGTFQGTGLLFGGADLVLLSPIFYLIKFLMGLF